MSASKLKSMLSKMIADQIEKKNSNANKLIVLGPNENIPEPNGALIILLNDVVIAPQGCRPAPQVSLRETTDAIGTQMV